jgi:hypothetical protein
VPSCSILHILELPEEKFNATAGMGDMTDLVTLNFEAWCNG